MEKEELKWVSNITRKFVAKKKGNYDKGKILPDFFFLFLDIKYIYG